MEMGRRYQVIACTDIWTGGIHSGHKSPSVRLTGIMGSIRWWFEILVRGLGGNACDPVGKTRCPEDRPSGTGNNHCVVCELFGCTGWGGRKFRLMIVDDRGQVIQDQIKSDQEFVLKFIPLRPIRDEEWCLLDLTLRLIADYGAIGGRTVFKPSDEQGRVEIFHHKDFGLISVEARPSDLSSCTREQLEEYVRQEHWRKGIPYQYRENGQEYDYSWASLKNFWYVKGRYLARQSSTSSKYNRVLGRDMRKNRAQNLWQDTEINRWLAGRQQESKKIFSFKHPTEERRTFGFVKPDLVDFEEIKRRLKAVWCNQGFNADAEFKTGEKILNELFQTGDEA